MQTCRVFAQTVTIVSGPDQSEELSMLDGDGIISPDSLQDIWRVDCTIREYFDT